MAFWGALRWSPDGSLLAAGTRNGEVLCWVANTQRTQWQAALSNQFVYSLAWSPDNTLLAVAFSDQVVWNVHSDQVVAEWKGLSIVPRMLSISTTQRVVVASDTGELLFGNVNESSPSATHPGYWFAAWSPARAELATLDAQRETMLMIWAE